MKGKELLLVKLGGSLITDKVRPYTLRKDVLLRLAREIHDAHEGFDLIVGHGGGSFPHQSAHRYQTQRGIINKNSWEGFSKVHDDAAKLNRIVVDAFIGAGENAISVPPSASTLSENSRIIRWDVEPIKKMLECGLLPVTYGDVGLDVKQGCCILSTEEVLCFLARKLGVKKVIVVGKVEGVLDAHGSLIEEINPRNFDAVKKALSGSDGADVTGGMLHKVERMLEAAKDGVFSEIINGEKKGYLKRALCGETGLGTVIRL